MYVCTYVCMCACMCMCVCVYVCIQGHVCVCMCTCMVHVHFPIIPACGRLREKDHEFEASFVYIVRLYQKNEWGGGGGVEDVGGAGREIAHLAPWFLSTSLLALCLQCPSLPSHSWLGPKAVFVYPLNTDQFCRTGSCIQPSFLSVFQSSTYANTMI